MADIIVAFLAGVVVGVLGTFLCQKLSRRPDIIPSDAPIAPYKLEVDLDLTTATNSTTKIDVPLTPEPTAVDINVADQGPDSTTPVLKFPSKPTKKVKAAKKPTPPKPPGPKPKSRKPKLLK